VSERLSDVYKLENNLFGMTYSECSERCSEVFKGVRVDSNDPYDLEFGSCSERCSEMFGGVQIDFPLGSDDVHDLEFGSPNMFGSCSSSDVVRFGIRCNFPVAIPNWEIGVLIYTTGRS